MTLPESARCEVLHRTGSMTVAESKFREQYPEVSETHLAWLLNYAMLSGADNYHAWRESQTVIPLRRKP